MHDAGWKQAWQAEQRSASRVPATSALFTRVNVLITLAVNFWKIPVIQILKKEAENIRLPVPNNNKNCDR